MTECAAGHRLLPEEVIRFEEATNGGSQSNVASVDCRPALYALFQIRRVRPEALQTIPPPIEIDYIGLVDTVGKAAMHGEASPVDVYGATRSEGLP